MNATMEEAVELTAKIYEMRRAARILMGDKYAATMAELGETIKIVQQKKKLSGPIEAAADICQNANLEPTEIILMMSALAELLEPTVQPSPQEAAK
jgi:hypothetical protein